MCGGIEKQNAIHIIVEEHPDGYTAFPLGLNGVVVAEGDTYEEALAEIRSAIQFHIETFGRDAFVDADTMEAFIVDVAGKRVPDR
ncbi:MAG: type II toxin-antitoxin system HicB family antitoxin [Methanocalculus sp.]|uniref:type II toxin-antitoxin system HicB family antitoxin n=1 Tax=Methanocalculus sp. TaxID=2004547 RepID=UPI00271CB454|nr:type II toxin-antitoxin system HicB family antitoxin [Methanocalculus sp.]MDO9539763.1 type II toxin-antitoxin system HicB family antitoxin [Methanocalculus sp.]